MTMSRFGLALGVTLLMPSLTAQAGGGEARLTLTEEPRTVAAEAGPMWELNGALTTDRVFDERSIFAVTSRTGMRRLPVALTKDGVGHQLTLTIPDAARDDMGEYVVVRLHGRYESGLNPEFTATLFFHVDDGRLIEESPDDHIARLTDTDGGFLPVRDAAFTPSELSHVAPWDNPDLSEAQKEAVTRKLGDKPGKSAVHSSALTAGDGVKEATGCSGTEDSTPWALALVALGLVFLRRRRATAAVLLVAVSVPSAAEAQTSRVVYGFSAYWDTRTPKSDANGSLLRACDTSDPTCGPADGLSCCFRAIPNAIIHVEQFGVVLDEYETDGTGLFILSFVGNDAWPFDFVLTYHRDDGPGQTRLTMTEDAAWLPPPAQTQVLLKKQSLGSSPYTYFARLNVNGAGDMTDIRGHVATVWRTIAEVQQVLTSQGDTRYRRTHGAAETDPDDLLLIRHLNKESYSDCTNADMNVQWGQARTLLPATIFAQQYTGRVVGCSTVYAQKDNPPAFPPSPTSVQVGSPDFASEGLALAGAISGVVTWLSRWDPDTVSTSTMRSTAQLACQTDNGINSNDATSGINSGLALWELLDSDTAGASGGTDSTDLTMRQLMDGIERFSTVSGYPGLNHSNNEAIYTQLAPVCLTQTNEECNNGDVCLIANGTPRCFTGDPHGINIYDAILWVNVAGILGGWSGLGDVVGTLNSSDCLGGADNSHPYNGGYRTD